LERMTRRWGLWRSATGFFIPLTMYVVWRMLACEAGAPRLRQVSWSHWPCCCAPEGSPWRITRQSHPNPPVPRTLTSRSAAGRRARRMPAARPRKSQRQCQSRHGLNRRTRARNAASPLPAAAVRREDPVTLSGPPSHLPDHQVVKPSLAVETVVSAGGWGAEVGWKSGAAGVGAAVRFDRVLLRLPLGQEWVHCTTGPGWARFDAGRRARLCHGDAPRWCPHAAGASAADPVTLLRLRSRDGRCRFRRFVLRRRQCPAARRTSLLPLCRVVAGRSRAHGAFLRPGTVSRLALERPG
jgi:hypothetical protein